MRLSLRSSQRVVMTPLLQQAIQLLQLSTLELEQVVRKELEENPLLEELPEEKQEVDGEVATATAADGTELAPAPAPTEPASKETSSVDGERADDLPFDLTSAVFDQQDERTPVSTEEREDLPFENLGRTATSLAEHLEEQLRLATDDPRMVAIGEAIIGNLDEDGYLRAGVDEIAKGMGVTAEEVESTLRIVQAFDPTGVAARSVQECLLLQLTADAEPDPVSVEIVEQRQRTLRKVTQSLVKFQRDFLDRGVAHLRPLALRDVGEDIGMHESTISRVTTNKYVETPQGLFELKYFFHSGIASDSGEMVSAVSVKKNIRDLVAAEDGGKPLSDQEIAQVLRGQGLTIARRTVAKYREELGILPSHQRRLQPKKR